MDQLTKRCPDCGWIMQGKTCHRCKLADYDSNAYMQHASRAAIDKTINTLKGIITGIAIDNKLNEKELAELHNWCHEHAALSFKHPYSELFDTIFNVIEDHVITLDEKDDLIWLCERLQGDGVYYDMVTSDMQELQGILHGIIADNVISKEELEGLQDWLADHEHLATTYPYDEIYGLIIGVLQDNVVTADEERMLKAFFTQFAEIPKNGRVYTADEAKLITKQGICAVDPEIVFDEHVFCFTGKSAKATRVEIADTVEQAGGKYHDAVVKKTNYLIVGNEGNPCWAFSCYGRKVEKAIELRKKGEHIVIVNELDFWDNL